MSSELFVSVPHLNTVAAEMQHHAGQLRTAVAAPPSGIDAGSPTAPVLAALSTLLTSVDHLALALDETGQRLRTTADTYAQADAATQDAVERVHGQL